MELRNLLLGKIIRVKTSDEHKRIVELLGEIGIKPLFEAHLGSIAITNDGVLQKTDLIKIPNKYQNKDFERQQKRIVDFQSLLGLTDNEYILWVAGFEIKEAKELIKNKGKI